MSGAWAGAAALAGVAVLVEGGPAGAARLRVMAAPPGPVVASPSVRTPWAIVGAIATALIVWMAAGGPAAGTGAMVTALLVGAAVGVALRVAVRRMGRGRPRRSDTGALAAGWDLLATCLESGLPVTTALDAAAGRIEGPVAEVLRRVGGALALGSPAEEAWAVADRHAETATFARAARRSADTGAGLARVARSEAERLRSGLGAAAEARAERAAVLVAAPLGLCFLPAFLALGIAPVVIGLAGEALARW
jgi:pilus assembly protein TadC